MSRERPILMSAPMVRALLAGTKTQTRRVAKIDDVAYGKPVQWVSVAPCTTGIMEVRCPYGQPGDRLWVRETWAAIDERALVTQRRDGIAYAATTTPDGNDARLAYGIKWRPSIHMPRWASRLTLEITGVRVERLQEISEGDAYDEGTAEWCAETQRNGNKWPNIVRAYQGLWESINGRGSWDANPWVWVLEFRTLERQ